jgi:drug/metabolite transporter (DMT)-like permease
MSAERTEKLIVLNLRILAASFAVVGACFIIAPDGTLNTISDLGDKIGDFPRAPETTEQFWLALAFAYMVVITGICLVAQADVARYRPMLLVLVAGKAASSLAALGFFLFDDNVFIYLLNFIVDGYLAVNVFVTWKLAERIEAAAPG